MKNLQNAGYLSQTNLIKKKTVSQVVVISDDLYQQRKTLIQLLKKNDPEFQYLAYLLYAYFLPKIVIVMILRSTIL